MYRSASVLAEAIRSGQLSSRDALEHYLERVGRLNERINAVIALDADGARQRADAADKAREAGETLGPLHGVPMSVKDSYEFAGLPTVCGEPSLTEHHPRTHAAAVQRLVDAGAIVFGKTNTPRLAQDVQTYNKVFGTTNNPWNPDHTSGGSSGGAAAALAAGLTPLELGSDLAGSIRTPAHYCGVYGHKPSYGLIPMRGHIPGPPGTLSEPDLAVAGPMARTAEDLVLAGPGDLDARGWRLELPGASAGRFEDFRIACWFEDPFSPVDAATSERMRKVVEALRDAGATVEENPRLPSTLEDLYTLYESLLNALIGAGLPRKMHNQLRRIAPWVRLLRRDRTRTMGRFIVGSVQSHRDWARANEARERMRRGWRGFFRRYDALLMPVTPTPAPPHNQQGNIYRRQIEVDGRQRPYVDQFSWIAPASVAGLPATSAPVGRSDDGLPINIQIVSDYMQDATTIELARLLAERIGGSQVPGGYE